MNTINREDGIKGRPSSCMSVENFMAIWIGFGVTHTIPVYCFGQNVVGLKLKKSAANINYTRMNLFEHVKHLHDCELYNDLKHLVNSKYVTSVIY